jgi:uncharacterized protein YjbJ (UPF0337 family)
LPKRRSFVTAVRNIRRAKLSCGAWIDPARPSYFVRTANKGDLMNKDQVKGRVEEAKGKIKEVTGRTVGNPDLEDRGTAQKVGGAIQKDYGDLKEDIKDSLKKPR